MIERRHQVFVSSTYVDLVEERSEVMQALLELECMPAGMELFPAAADSQWDWIKRVIDASDYYMVIVGARYGTISRETGQSYTEMEYRYALEMGKPVIGFLHESPSSIAVKLAEHQAAKIKKLDAFRGLVQSKLCKFYNSPADLGAKVSRSITQLRTQHPKAGWVRANVLEGLVSSDEMLQLRRENDDLRARIAHYGLEAPRLLEQLSNGADLVEIAYACTWEVLNSETGRYRKKSGYDGVTKLSWDLIFKIIGPELLESSGNYWHASNAIARLVEAAVIQKLEKKNPNSRFVNFKIYKNSTDTVMLQFRALKLVELNEEKRWQLTPYGDNYLTSLLGVRRGEARPNS